MSKPSLLSPRTTVICWTTMVHPILQLITRGSDTKFPIIQPRNWLNFTVFNFQIAIFGWYFEFRNSPTSNLIKMHPEKESHWNAYGIKASVQWTMAFSIMEFYKFHGKEHNVRWGLLNGNLDLHVSPVLEWLEFEVHP